MSREEARRDIEKLNREHEERVNRMAEAQKAAVNRYQSNMADLNESFNTAHQELNAASVEHESSMNKLRENEAQTASAESKAHQDRLKEMTVANNQRLDDLRNKAAIAEKEQIEHNSNEKRQAELNRLQLNREIQERLAREMEETARQRAIADEQEKERSAILYETERRNIGDLKVMQNALLNMAKEEKGRLELHARKMQSLQITEVAQAVKMNQAEMRMSEKRSAYELVDEISNEINNVVRKFNGAATIIRLAAKTRKALVLRVQQVPIQRNVEAMKTAVTVVQDLIEKLMVMSIDTEDENRKGIARCVKRDMEIVDQFHNSVLNSIAMMDMIEPEEVLISLHEDVEAGQNAIDSIKSLWETLPPVDRSNLVYAQFLETTDIVLKGGSLALDEGKLMKALEDSSSLE